MKFQEKIVKVSMVLATVSLLLSLFSSILLYSLIDKYTKPFRDYTIVQKCKKEEVIVKELVKKINKEELDDLEQVTFTFIPTETEIEVVETDCCIEFYALIKDCVEHEYELVRK